MATIKSFTDLEQSKKLAEILPLESADMHYVLIDTAEDKYAAGLGKYIGILPHYPCWSLAALLKLFPKSAQLEKGNVTELYRATLPVELEASDWYIDPLDACYELILKLNELKML